MRVDAAPAVPSINFIAGAASISLFTQEKRPGKIIFQDVIGQTDIYPIPQAETGRQRRLAAGTG